MNEAAIYHISEYIYAYAVDDNTVRIRLKAERNDIKACKIIYKNLYDHSEFFNEIQMKKIRKDKVSDWFEQDLYIPDKRVKYYFKMEDKKGEMYFYNPDGLTQELKSPPIYFYVPYLFGESAVKYPEWAEGAIIYQILVDRFCNGDSSNDPENIAPWGSLPDCNTFYGGDLKGIIDKLDYIHSLGTGVIYMNPVFLSPTYHKYDIVDYYMIDPHFGTKEQLKELVDKAHKLGMKVILDAVFNHSSDENHLFEDVVVKGTDSQFSQWYDIYSFPVVKHPPNYDCFARVVYNMPRLRTSNPEVQDYLIKTAEYWTRYLNIDGWRLDVADEVSPSLWKKFRTRLKNINPDILILGEIWNQSTQWLMGDEFDNTTNYKFRDAIIQFALNNEMHSEDFWNLIARNEMKYKSTNLPVMVNLIGSHDTSRILSVLKQDRELARLVLCVMLTYTGMPLIYYGDEVGMSGEGDQQNRYSMQWDEQKQDKELLKAIKTLGNARKSTNALSKGGLIENRNVPVKVMAFSKRADDGSEVLIAANFGSKREVVTFSDVAFSEVTLITGQSSDVKITGKTEISIGVNPRDIIVLSNTKSYSNQKNHGG